MYKQKAKMEQNKILKGSRGITLIALVITIIVLLILVAVSISTLTGENGILTQATRAGEKTTEETEKEEIKLSYNVAKSKKYEEGDYTGEITAKDLEDELKKQNPKMQVKESSNPIEVTFPSGDVYTVDGKTGEIKGPTEEKLTKEVLQIDPDAVEDSKKSPYVTYNNILCRVLYNDTEHGLQIISADNEGEVTLGYEDINEKVSASDFDYEGSATNVDNNFKKAASSYNRAVDTLNDKAKTYKDNSGIVLDARSLGSKSTLTEDGKFQLDDTATMYPPDTNTKYEYLATYNWNGKFKNTDTNYLDDVDTLQNLDLNATNWTWMASRRVLTSSDYADFAVRIVSSKRGCC